MIRNHKKKSKYFLGNPLSADDIFCALTPSNSRTLSSLKRKRKFQKGSFVFARGDPPNNVYILLKGKARIILDTDSQFGRISRLVEQNEVFALQEAVAHLPHQMTLETVTSCIFESIRREDLVEFLKNESGICFRLVELLGKDFQNGQQLFSSSI